MVYISEINTLSLQLTVLLQMNTSQSGHGTFRHLREFPGAPFVIRPLPGGSHPSDFSSHRLFLSILEFHVNESYRRYTSLPGLFRVS